MRRLRALSTPLPPQSTAVEVCADFEPYRLVQARQMNGWTRKDLAEASGLTPQQICWFEVGVQTPKAYELEQIADATGCLVAFFKRGRPMLVLDSSALHMCSIDR